jgi:hypothetical protein
MEYVEIDEDGYYGKLADGRWVLTPLGLAGWADDEGGWESLLYGKGKEPFIEAGVGQNILSEYIAARNQMVAELDRIGATL